MMSESATVERVAFTPPELANRLGVSPQKIIAWIKSGELPASNLATTLTGERPQFRVLGTDFEDFLRRRSVVPHVDVKRTRRAATAGVREYF